MPEQPNSLQMLADIEALVRRTRARRRRDRLVAGVAWTLALALGTLLALAMLDMAAPLEDPARLAAAATILSVLLIAFLLCLARPLLRPEPVAKIAFLIEAALTGMHNRLVTALDLRQASNLDEKLADPFVHRLLEQTRQRLAAFTPSMVADAAPTRRAISAAALAMVVGGTLLFGLGDRFTTAVRRLLDPAAPIAPVSSVAYAAVPGDARVLEGEPITLAAKFTRGSAPLSVRIRPAGSAWTTYPLEPGPDNQPAFVLSSVGQPTQYQVVGGGTWTPVHHIDVIRRPRIEALAASVKMPDYMRIAQPRLIEGDLSVISAPVGATVRISATVSGHAARGVVKAFKPSTVAVKEKQDQELVWFDDSLPPDSETTAPWRWVSESAHSGTKAFTFDWARKPFGFKTRLATLPIAAGSSFFVYAWLDPADPPGRVTVTAAIGNRSYAIRFDDPARAAAPGGLAGKNTPLPANTVAVDGGPLPAPGRWARLSVPIDKIIGSAPAAPVEVIGLAFEADAGRALFDRVGSVQTLTRDVTQTRLDPIGTFELKPASPGTQPATRPSATPTAQWVADLPVDKDYSFTLELATEAGHPSPPASPMSIVATADAPPTIILEKPAKSVLLAQPQPVPVMLRVFDDYGVADVGVQTGKSPTELGPVHWFKSYADNVTSDLVLSALDPSALDLKPGGAITFQMIVRDRKGQVAASEPLRLALASAAELAGANVDKGSAPLTPIFDTLKKLVGAQAALAGSAANLADVFDIKDAPATTQPERSALISATQPLARVELKKDGLTKIQVEQKAEEAVAVAVAQAEAERLTVIKLLDEATNAAQKSPTALPGEAAALAMLSANLLQDGLEQKAMAQAALAAAKLAEKQTEANPELEKAVADRLAKLQELTDEQKKEMEQIAKQIEQIEAARKDLATDPQAANDRMQALLTQQRAEQASDQLETLDDTLESKQAQLEAMRAQLAALREQTAGATPAELAELAKASAEAQRQALEQMAQMKDLLRDDEAGMNAERQPEEMPAPWTPPGQEFESTPVERDTPAKKDPSKPEDAAAAAAMNPPAKKDQAAEWDQPPIPPIGSTVKEDERYKDRETRPDVADTNADPFAPQPTDTKRQSLEKSQGRFEQALTAAAKRAQASQDRLDQMQSEMQGAMSKLDGQSQSPAEAAKTAQQLQRMMNSDQMRAAMAASRRAQQQAYAQAVAAAKSGAEAKAAAAKAGSQTPSQAQSNASAKVDGKDKLDTMVMPPMGLSGPPQGVSGSDRGYILSVDLSGVEAPGKAAGYYRLPPHIRDPLIQGLRETAPEGYQPLIDAYYRQLGAEGK